MRRALLPSSSRRSDLVDAAVVVALCLILAALVRPWLARGIDWHRMADAPNHLVRVFVIDAALERGEWFPRWLSDLYLGYGYPLLNYYAPSTYYLAAALHRLGMTIYGSLQWTGVIAVALGATGAYALASATVGGRGPALLAAAVFVFAPYPFLTNLYVRGAVPEVLALGLLPWLLLAGWGAWHTGRGWVVAFGALTAAVLLTHNVTSLLSMGMLALWLCFNAIGTGVTRRAVVRSGVAVTAGLALSAFFWLPALAESGYVQLDLAQGGLYDFRNWLFDPLRLTPGVARPDYPHTRLGPADLSLVFDYAALGKAAPEKISLAQLALWLAALVLGLAGLLRRQRAAPAGKAAVALERAAPARLALAWAGVALVCWYFGTVWSRPLWERLPLLPLVQFPWRLYGPLALCLALAAAGAMASLSPGSRTGTAGRLALLVCAGLLAYGSLAARPSITGAEPLHDVDEHNVADLEKNRYGAGTTSGGEFLPRTVGWGYDSSGVRRGIRMYDDAYPQAGWQAGLARLLEGRGAITNIHSEPHWIRLELNAETPAKVGFHQLLFPGWQAYVDDRPVLAAPSRYDGPIEAALGFMVVDVPPGEHRVEVRFGPTPIRLIAGAISAGALAAALAWLILPRLVRLLPAASQAAQAWANPAYAGALAALVGLGGAGCAAAGAARGAYPSHAAPPASARVVADVVGAFARSQAEVRSPAGSGPHSAYVDVRHLEIGGELRRWLYMHPASEVAIRLRVPPHAYLQAGLALEPRAWIQDVGDGVRFLVEAEGAFGRTTLLDRHVHPRARGEDRGWIDTWVDLEPLAGQDVRLILRTDSGQDPWYDWAGWSNPQVVLWDAPRPHPGTRHLW